MVQQSSVESKMADGPSGFLSLANDTLVVDYGRILTLDGTVVGYLFEDGYLADTSGPLGSSDRLRAIEEIGDCAFRGIDSHGLELELPGPDFGPWGSLTYNNVAYHVANGRICTREHGLAGFINDEGLVSVRDHVRKEKRRLLEEFPQSGPTQLNSFFQGKKSDGKSWNFEFNRPMYRRDKTYGENEIIRYFQDYDRVSVQQKKYVLESMALWSSSGLLQIVRKTEGNAGLSTNVKHGAAGITQVKSAMVHLEKQEFEREVVHYKEHGAVAAMMMRIYPYVEVRVNLVVSHEFGHQLEFVLSQKTQDKIEELYERRARYCNRAHPSPSGYEGLSEILRPEQVEKDRCFISGYAKHSWHEYWAECVAAFSVPQGRAELRRVDPAIVELLTDVIYQPENVLRPNLHDTILALQASLRMGGEFDDRMLDP